MNKNLCTESAEVERKESRTYAHIGPPSVGVPRRPTVVGAELEESRTYAHIGPPSADNPRFCSFCKNFSRMINSPLFSREKSVIV